MFIINVIKRGYHVKLYLKITLNYYEKNHVKSKNII